MNLYFQVRTGRVLRRSAPTPRSLVRRRSHRRWPRRHSAPHRAPRSWSTALHRRYARLATPGMDFGLHFALVDVSQIILSWHYHNKYCVTYDLFEMHIKWWEKCYESPKCHPLVNSDGERELENTAQVCELRCHEDGGVRLRPNMLRGGFVHYGWCLPPPEDESRTDTPTRGRPRRLV